MTPPARDAALKKAINQSKESDIKKPDIIKMMSGSDASILVDGRDGPQNDILTLNPDKKTEPHITLPTIEMVRALTNIKRVQLPDPSKSVEHDIFVTSITGDTIDKNGQTLKREQDILLIFGQPQISGQHTPPLHASDSQLAAFAVMLNKKLIAEAAKYGKEQTKRSWFKTTKHIDIGALNESAITASSTPDQIISYFSQVISDWEKNFTTNSEPINTYTPNTVTSFQGEILPPDHPRIVGEITREYPGDVYSVNQGGQTGFLIRDYDSSTLFSSRPLGTPQIRFLPKGINAILRVDKKGILGTRQVTHTFKDYELKMPPTRNGDFLKRDWRFLRDIIEIRLNNLKGIKYGSRGYIQPLNLIDFHPTGLSQNTSFGDQVQTSMSGVFLISEQDPISGG